MGDPKAKTSTPQQGVLTQFFKPDKQSVGHVLAKLAAEDRIPFNTIANSKEINAGLRARGLKVPSTANGIKNAVFSYASEIEDKLRHQIKERLAQDGRYSVSLDEYTSISNRRYMCLNIHDGEKAISLGMIRVKGSMPAETGLELVTERLNKFGLSLKRHIVGCCCCY